MKLSLIVPTLHRTVELGRLLRSILDQEVHPRDLEILIVDQNRDRRLARVLAPYRRRLGVLWLRIPPRGVSNAKNVGLKRARGRFVGFPDDDCWYPPRTVEGILAFFKRTKGRSGLFARGLDPATGSPSLPYPRKERVIVSPRDPDVFLGIQWAQFHPLAAVRRVGGFDEGIVCGEETDLAIRILGTGLPIHFQPEIQVHHPLVHPLRGAREMSREKLEAYGMGFGRLCRGYGFGGLLVRKSLKAALGAVFYAGTLRFEKSARCVLLAFARWKGYREAGRGRGRL